MPPPISIFIPVYNDAKWLRGALDSVVGQDYEHWEVVVGDNVSTDAVEAIVNEYGDSRIRYHRWETHVPIDENFNRTALLARHDWIQLLCADDRLRPGCLATIAAGIEQNSTDGERLAMVLTACRRVDENGNSADHIWYGTKRRFSVPSGRYGAAKWFQVHLQDGHPPWNVGSVAIARHVIEESGGFFRPEVGLSCDVEQSIRASAYGDVVYIDEPLLDFTVRSDADSSVRLWMNRRRNDDRTPVEAALVAGLNVHRHRRDVTDGERAAVRSAVARTHLQRAAQHRVLDGGRGRRGAWADVRAAWRWSWRTAARPYHLAYALAAIAAPRPLLELAKNRLSSRHQ